MSVAYQMNNGKKDFSSPILVELNNNQFTFFNLVITLSPSKSLQLKEFAEVVAYMLGRKG